MAELGCPHSTAPDPDCSACATLAAHWAGYHVLVVRLTIAPRHATHLEVGLLETACCGMLANGHWRVWHPHHDTWQAAHPLKHTAVLRYLACRLGDYGECTEELRHGDSPHTAPP